MIEFAAMGNTIPIALDGTYKFNQLGLKAVSSTIWESQEAFSRLLREKDIMFAISASGASKHLLNMVEIAKENKAVTVAVTNQAKSPLAEACDYVLLTATREHIFPRSGEFYKNGGNVSDWTVCSCSCFLPNGIPSKMWRNTNSLLRKKKCDISGRIGNRSGGIIKRCLLFCVINRDRGNFPVQ